MILFLEDWGRYPNAIVDIKTKNTSFLRTAGVLKAMGVKNHAFLLALHNPALQGIDPHDPNLDPITIKLIGVECKENPWYVFREVIKVPAKSTVENPPLQANRGNIALWWLFFNHITMMLIQPRQTGKSLSTDSLMVNLICISTINTAYSLLTKDDSLRTHNVARLKELISNLPWYLNLRSKKDANNTERITINRLGNTYETNVAQLSPKAALNIGRGMTNAINHVDEIAFISNIDITLPAMLAATGAARDNAKAANAPYGNVFTTTAGFLSNDSGKYAYKIYSESLRWSEKLLDCQNEEDLVNTIKKNSPGGRVQVLCEFNHRQLGKTDEWLREKIADALSEGENAEADFLNKWAEGSETSPIAKELLIVINNSKISDPFTLVSSYGYITRWYIPEYEVNNKCTDRKLVMSLDTSEAIGNDDIAMTIRDATTGELVAAGVYNETNTITFADWIVDWIVEWDNITVIIERKNTGVSIIDNILKILPLRGVDPFRRLFNWVTNNYHENKAYNDEVINVPFSRRHPDVYVKYRKEFGYTTAGSGVQARSNLYGTAFNASIKYTSDTVRDATLIKQLNGLIKKNDRIDHKPGEHDDMVVSWLLSYWFLTKANNLSFYGLSSRTVLSTVINAMVKEQGGYEAIQEKNRQAKIKLEIENLLDLLKLEQNPLKSMVIVNRIRMMYKDITEDDNHAFNIESLLESINLEKKKFRRY